MDEVDPAFFCPENVFFICYIHMKEKIGKNIQYLLTWYVYRYIVIPTTKTTREAIRSTYINERIRF